MRAGNLSVGTVIIVPWIDARFKAIESIRTEGNYVVIRLDRMEEDIKIPADRMLSFSADIPVLS